MEQLFRQLVKKPDASLYLYQEKAAKTVLEGINIIISAPTGAGKTWAALLPFLYSKKISGPVADRVIYSLPMRTLATSLYESTVESCRQGGWMVETDPVSNIRTGNPESICITIQTGERKEDPFFQGDIIFTTIDQMLSGYLNIPVSIPDKLANINAGSMIGSLIVLDEIHLLEPECSLGTVIEMCFRLRGLAQFVFMTATLSEKSMIILEEKLSARRIAVDEAELNKIPNQKNKEKVYNWVDKPMNAERILDVHGGGRSIVICNSVGRAQEMYRSIKEQARSRGLSTEILLLHSRFFKKDRNKVEKVLAEYLGRDACKTDVILVATQAVEAGVDISAENLHTELAPANSVVQRAGRSARYEGERGKGTVWIYELQTNEKGQYKMGPYREQAEIVNLTRVELAKPPIKMDFMKEYDLVNKIMEKAESQCFERVVSGLGGRHLKVNKVIELAGRSGAGSYRKELIRDVDSVNIVVHDNPEKIDLYKPLEYISVPRIALWSLNDSFANNTGPWVAKIPSVAGSLGEEESDYVWIKVDSIQQLMSSGWLIAIHPNAASYSEELGLELGKAGTPPVHPLAPKPVILKPKYKCETFRQHSLDILKEGRRIQGCHSVGLSKIADFLNISVEVLGKLIDTVLVLHDIGKLSKKWQEAAWLRQALVDPYDPIHLSGEPLAHSTFDWDAHRHLEEELRKPQYQRGNHSVEGAFCIAEGLLSCVEELITNTGDLDGISCSLWSAVARHHNAGASSLSSFELINGIEKYVGGILEECGLRPVSLKDKPNKETQIDFGEEYLLKPSTGGLKFLPLYWMAVRLLRLADQASQRKVLD
ncbi:MAG: CRISPR-associated helicase Cas3' [Peptococcaceae bacterium]|nr:CRISPR-associated helicase Cas3' [Peptococcaceae bacterium]